MPYSKNVYFFCPCLERHSEKVDSSLRGTLEKASEEKRLMNTPFLL